MQPALGRGSLALACALALFGAKNAWALDADQARGRAEQVIRTVEAEAARGAAKERLRYHAPTPAQPSSSSPTDNTDPWSNARSLGWSPAATGGCGSSGPTQRPMAAPPRRCAEPSPPARPRADPHHRNLGTGLHLSPATGGGLTTQAHQRTLTPRRAGRARVTPARGVDRRNNGLERPCPSQPPTTPLIQSSPS